MSTPKPCAVRSCDDIAESWFTVPNPNPVPQLREVSWRVCRYHEQTLNDGALYVAGGPGELLMGQDAPPVLVGWQPGTMRELSAQPVLLWVGSDGQPTQRVEVVIPKAQMQELYEFVMSRPIGP